MKRMFRKFSAMHPKIIDCKLIKFRSLAQQWTMVSISACFWISNAVMIWDIRQHAALSRAELFLAEAESALACGDAMDAVCTVVESALAALDETDGREVNGEIVDAIFARFCVGK